MVLHLIVIISCDYLPSLPRR